MPLDPSIILGYKAPQIEGPMQSMTQALTLKDLMQQGQVRQQQIQAGQLENQQRQGAMDDQSALNESMRTAMNPDGSFNQDGVLGKLASSGRGHMIPGLRKSFADADKASADLKEAQGKVLTAQADYGGSLGAVVRAGGYDPHLFAQKVARAVADKQIDPQTAQQYVALAAQGPDKIKPIVDQLIAASPAQSKLENERVTADAHKQTADTGAARLEAEKPKIAADVTIAQQTAAGTKPIQPAEQATIDQSKATLANTEAYQKVEAGQRAQGLKLEGARVGIEGARYNLEKSKQGQIDDPLKGLSGAQMDYLKKVANGDLPLPSPRSKNYQQTVEGAMAVDPTFTAQRYIGKTDFKTKGDANSIMGLSTALAHLDSAKTNSAALGFNPSESLNITPAQHKYHADVDMLTGEVGKLIKNGVVTEGEAGRITSNLHSMRQGNRDAALTEMSNLMSGKVGAIAQKYKNSTGQDLPVTMFDAKTQGLLKKYGQDIPGINTGAAGAGGGGGQPAAAPSIQDLRAKYKY